MSTGMALGKNCKVAAPLISDELWRRVLPLVEKALAEPPFTYTAADLYGMVQRGELTLLYSNDFANVMLVEFLIQGEATVAYVLLAAGEGFIEYIRAINNEFELWCKANGARYIMLAGRAGWSRVLGNYGYHAKLGMWKDISDGR